MRRRHLCIAAAAAVSGLAACAGSDGDIAQTSDAVATTSARPITTAGASSVPATVADSTATPATPASTIASTTTIGPEAAALELCSYASTFVLGQVANPTLDETSGLVASRRHRDVIWAHNDGSETTGLFALGRDGADLGFHPIDVDGVVDVEDVAMISGPGGDEVLLGDIGDNGAQRSSIRIYRFAEPDPTQVAPITDVQVLEYTYPDRPHNAEVLLVDEVHRRIVIVTKEQRTDGRVRPELGPTEPSFVFEGPLDTVGDEPVELTATGMLDAPLLETRTVAAIPHPATLLGIGGVPTGGDVSPDGAVIALRTYETIWVWPRRAGRTVAESLIADPCQVRVAPERQGEAVAFFDGTLVTVSEGANPYLLHVRP